MPPKEFLCKQEYVLPGTARQRNVCALLTFASNAIDFAFCAVATNLARLREDPFAPLIFRISLNSGDKLVALNQLTQGTAFLVGRILELQLKKQCGHRKME